jgi:hypothetical protein
MNWECGRKGPWLIALMMEAVSTSETLDIFYQITSQKTAIFTMDIFTAVRTYKSQILTLLMKTTEEELLKRQNSSPGGENHVYCPLFSKDDFVTATKVTDSNTPVWKYPVAHFHSTYSLHAGPRPT